MNVFIACSGDRHDTAFIPFEPIASLLGRCCCGGLCCDEEPPVLAELRLWLASPVPSYIFPEFIGGSALLPFCDDSFEKEEFA